MKPIAIAVVALACCTVVQAQAPNKSQKQPPLKTVAMTSSAAAQPPAPERVEPPAWFKDETVRAAITNALPEPFKSGKLDFLEESLHYPREHGRFMGGGYFDPQTGKPHNYAYYIRPDGGLLLIAPDWQLRVTPHKGMWYFVPIDPSVPGASGSIPK